MAFLRFRIPTWLGGRTRGEAARAESVDNSVDKIDSNAASGAAADQSRKDDAAERQGNPAEQGGEG